jgi:hypothetical protein
MFAMTKCLMFGRHSIQIRALLLGDGDLRPHFIDTAQIKVNVHCAGPLITRRENLPKRPNRSAVPPRLILRLGIASRRTGQYKNLIVCHEQE